MKIFVILIIFVLTSNISAEKARYDYYKVIKINVETPNQVTMLQDLENMCYLFSSVPQRTGESINIIISPHKLAEFEEIIKNFQLKTLIFSHNLQTELDQENDYHSYSYSDRFNINKFSWNKYNTLEEIYEWLNQLVQTYPAVVTPFEVGESYEKRKIRGIKISHKVGNPIIFVESC